MGAGPTREEIRDGVRRAFKALAKELPNWKPVPERGIYGLDGPRPGQRITWELQRASNGEACLRFILYCHTPRTLKTIDRAELVRWAKEEE